MKRKAGIILAFGLISFTGYPQEQTNAQILENIRYDQSGNIKYLKFDLRNKSADWNGPSSPDIFWKDILGIQEQNRFIEKNRLERKDGSFYVQYRQYYKGVSVEDGIYILHFRNGKIEKANGHYVNITELDTSPKLKPYEACKSYCEYLQLPNSAHTDFSYGIIIAEIEEFTGQDSVYMARLCYKIDLLDSQTDNGQTGYVDARTGKVVKMVERYDGFSATGTFSTLYSDTLSANTQYYSNTFNLCDSSRNAVIHTWDLNNAFYTNYANSVEFTDNDNNWTENEHSANNDQMALDIHWVLQEIYDYFDENHDGFQGFDGNNHDINAYVHTVFDNNSKDNAAFIVFVDGYEAFFFGDGYLKFKPLAAIDVVSHEYGHGITYNFTGLNNDYEVQKSMNEGFSDIWGATVENSIAPAKDCWKIGEEVIDVIGDNCLRNLENPESSTANLPIADTYDNDIYNDGGTDGAYEKSGVMSHWFYLLAEGGSGTNDNDDDYIVYGLGIEEATKVVFEGQTGHFGSVTSYPEARIAMVDASDIIYGENSMQSLQVANAWYAVGVGSDPGQVSLTGSDLVCYSGTVFTANNFPTGSTISWSTSLNLEVYSGGNTNTPTIKAKYSTSNLDGWVQVNFTSNGITMSGPRKDVWVGPPYVNPATIQFECADGSGYLCTNAFGNSFSFSYLNSYNYFDIKFTNLNETQVLDEFTIYSTESTIDYYPSEGTYKFWVRGNNDCGTATNWSKTTVDYIDCGEGLLSLEFLPNPTINETTLKIVSANEDVVKIDNNEEWGLEVYAQNQVLKILKPNIKGQEFILNTSDWNDGIYFVRVNYKNNFITGKLIVKK